jgi:hypothetical protein
MSKVFAKVEGTWTQIQKVFAKVEGVWTQVYANALTPSIQYPVNISYSSSVYPTTLTGYNYYWTNSTSLSYVFQSSPDNATWTTQSSGTATNPASGGSNTYTYSPASSVWTISPMYFRFSVTATNSTYSTSATSTSGSTSITYPAPVIAVGSWSGTFTAGGFIVYNSGASSYATSSTVYVYRSDGTFLGAFGGGGYGFYTSSADVGYYFYAYTVATGPGGTTYSSTAYSPTIAAAGVAPSAPPGLYGSNDNYPHGGHFYWSASSGTTPIYYYWTLVRNGSFYASGGPTLGQQIVTAATGSFTCTVYATNAYGTSSSSYAGPVTFT